MEQTESEFSHHTSCDDCGSSDGRAVYTNGSSYCFACESWSPPTNGGDYTPPKQYKKLGMIDYDIQPLGKRKIPESICKQYKYGIGSLGGKPCQIAVYYNKDKQPIAQKVRFADKTFKFLGDTKDAMLYGQQLWSSGGKKLTITEGEIDTLSVATAFDGKYPVVSISTGAQSAKKELSRHLEWISSFDEIYLWFDNDEPGRKSIEECVNILPIEKVRIVRHPDYKDANELLIAKGKPSVVNAFYNAEPYKPEGICIPEDIMEEALQPVEIGRPWFFEKLTNITYGRRLGEIVSLGAGVSVGKTDVVMTSIAFDLKQGYNVGTFMLEQSTRETLLRISGKIDGCYYHLPDQENDPKKLKATIQNIKGLYIYDNFGMIDWDTIASKIRFMKHSFGVEHFYIDNLTALNAAADDERRNLDKLMAEVAGLAQELNVWILLVSHLNPPKKGASHEAGGKVEQAQFTGSRSIMRWSALMMGVERNTIAEELEERQKGLIRIIKDRFSGQATGLTIGFRYDVDTGQLLEADDIDQLQDEETEEDF
jgi:twinkle protein